MKVITFTKLGRTLLMAAVLVVGAVCVSYGGGGNPSDFEGNWVPVDGGLSRHNLTYPMIRMVLFKDGTGFGRYRGNYQELNDGITWKLMGNRFAFEGVVCDYRLEDYVLNLDCEDDGRIIFVRKENLEEYEKEYKKKKAEERIEKISSYFTDSRDGQKYRTVKIGSFLTWMAQNLNYQTGNSWCYGGNNSNCEKYGRLYDWNTAKTACPAGWHLPSRQEWDNLGRVARGERTLDDKGNINWNGSGKVLKSTYGWDNNGNGTDEFGFSALPGAARKPDGDFITVGYSGYWWTATAENEGSGKEAYCRFMLYKDGTMYEGKFSQSYGLSVRCVAD